MKPTPFTTTEIEAFAARYGLTKLTKEHLVRLQELAPIAARLGNQLPRPKRKSDGPAPSFAVIPVIKNTTQ